MFIVKEQMDVMKIHKVDKGFVIHLKEKMRFHHKTKKSHSQNQNVKGNLSSSEIKSIQAREKAKRNAYKRRFYYAAYDTGGKVMLDHMDGGEEMHDSYMVMKTGAAPVVKAAYVGKRLYRKQKRETQEERHHKDKDKNGKMPESSKGAKKDKPNKVGQVVAYAEKIPQKAGKKSTVSGIASSVGGGVAGLAVHEAVSISMDKKEMKQSTRKRMLQHYISKLRREEKQDSVGDTVKDIVLMRVSLVMKYIIRYLGLAVLALFLLIILAALPIIFMISVIYYSPFAILFPSLSNTDSIQEVLDSYVLEFETIIEEEFADLEGYDESELIYVDDVYTDVNDVYSDILAVYAVRYGFGENATDMTVKSRENLKSVFDEMCSYSVSEREEIADSEDKKNDNVGSRDVIRIKEILIDLDDYKEMTQVYGFDEEEQSILRELMEHMDEEGGKHND